MKIKEHYLHPKSLDEAKIIQQELVKKIIMQEKINKVNYVAGVDVAFQDNYKITKAAIAVLKFPSLELVESQTALIPTTFPYIPNFLSFREN